MLNTSAEYKVKVYDGVRKFTSRATIEMDAFAKDFFSGIRYIRDWTNGNSANTTNYWNSIKAFSGSTDLALGILPTTNGTMTNGVNITDGNDATYGYAWAGHFYAQIDLGVVRTDIDKIQVIHYYADGRTFYDTKTEVSADGVTWITLRDSAIDGTYVETAEGQIFTPNKETIKVYDDNTIVKMKILEEMSTLNESLPSNELELTLDNFNGDFDLLNFSNMQKILASKPTITTEMGLVYDIQKGENGVVNGNMNFASLTDDTAVDWLKYGTGFATNAWTQVDGYTGTAQRMYAESNSYIGINSGYDLKGVNPSTTLHFRFLYKGYDPNYVYLMKASGNQKFTPQTRVFDGEWMEAYGSLVTSNTALDDIGLLIGFDTRTSLVNGEMIVDDVWFSDVPYGELIEFTEWLPTGKFFLTEWKNEITNKVITLIGNDYFNLFNEISYEPTGITNLKLLAEDVLSKGGVPSANQIIDESLSAIVVNPFPERIDIRTALQYIGIVSGSAVSQDRNGNVFIKPFKTIDESSNYITYTTQQSSLFGYVGPGVYLLNDTGGGMKYLDFDQMYEAPKVGLDKSIYQLVVKVYTNGLATEHVYTNSFIEGTSGQSFTIDNPLIRTVEQADKVAQWYMKEKNYNATYSVRWRGNPALECADVILVEDSFSAEKQTRITRQELNFSGYLEGITESRGGV